MKLTIVGSGTLVPDPTRVSAAHLLQGEDFDLLMDVGTGSVRRMARLGLPWRTLTHVAITHFHSDHLGDLPALMSALAHGLEAPREQPLHLIGPPGLARHLAALGSVFGSAIERPGFPVSVVELEPGDEVELGRRGILSAHAARHSDPSLAFRVDASDASVGYTGDTGPRAGLGAFFRGVDVLVAECAFPDPSPLDTHLAPADLAALLSEARPGTCLVTHAYPTLDPTTIPDRVRAAGYAGTVVDARDGSTLVLGT